MPPKARARAKAKVRAARVTRKPAENVSERRRPAKPGVEGSWISVKDIRLEDLKPGDRLLVKGEYYQAEVMIAGLLREVSVTTKGQYLVFSLEGTQSEDLMKWGTLMTSGGREALLWVHLCPATCKKDFVQDDLLHLIGLQAMRKKEDWMENCMPVVVGGVGDLDELRQLRGAMNALPPAGGPKPSGVPAEGEAEQPREDEKREEGTQSGKGVLEVIELLLFEVEVCSLCAFRLVFLMYFLTRTFESSPVPLNNTSASLTTALLGRTLLLFFSFFFFSQRSRAGGLSFGEEARIRQLSRSCPGGLTKMALREVRNLLLVSTGEAEAPGAIGPLFVRYWRQNLRRRMSPVLNRESLTVAYALELRGRVASAADVLCQRLKSLESLSRGSHWSTCQKLEVVPEEGASLVGREEAKIAGRSHSVHILLAPWEDTRYQEWLRQGQLVKRKRATEGWPRKRRKERGRRKGGKASKTSKEACGQGASAGLEVTVTGRGVADNVAVCSPEPWLGGSHSPRKTPKFNVQGPSQIQRNPMGVRVRTLGSRGR